MANPLLETLPFEHSRSRGALHRGNYGIGVRETPDVSIAVSREP